MIGNYFRFTSKMNKKELGKLDDRTGIKSCYYSMFSAVQTEAETIYKRLPIPSPFLRNERSQNI